MGDRRDWRSLGKKCNELFAHSMDRLETESVDQHRIKKRCAKCGYTETLPRSARGLYFFNNHTLQRKKLASDDNRKELLQPLNNDGSVNKDFTEAYGYNPFDKRTEHVTPEIQKNIRQE